MKTLKEIKDKVAQQYGFFDYKEFCQLTRNVDTDIVFIMDGFINKFATILQQEQQKVIADNADTKMERYNDLQDVLVVDRSSIINENNIIR